MIRALFPVLALCAAAVSWAGPARAATLDHVRDQGVVRCGAALRPGLAFPAVDGVWYGLEVQVCRAVAAAVLGDPDRIDMHSYVIDTQFARAGDGSDDVSFLSASEVSANSLFGRVLVGPPVFYQTTRVMVWEDSPVRHVADLRGTMVCGEPGTGPERNLQDYMKRKAIPFSYSMWQEVEEMMDAFSAGRCPAVVGEETALAALRLGAENDGHPSRLLPEPLAASPISATTPATDPAWARIVFWTVQTVLAADRSPGVQGPSLPAEAAELGLAPGWQDRVVKAVGTYEDAFAGTLGAGSPLRLAPGLNARWNAGGLFAPPTVE